MKVSSRLSFFLFPIAALVTICSGGMLLGQLAIIVIDYSILADVEGMALMLFLAWVFLFPLILIWAMLRNFVIHADKLEVNYLFGIIKYFYDYKTLQISDYFWRTNGVLIQIPDGDQLTLGEKQYKNYNEIRELLEERIPKAKINVRYTNRFTRLMFIIGGFLLTFLLVTMN